MGAECHKHGVDLLGDTFNGLVCPVCEKEDVAADRDRYREALELIRDTDPVDAVLDPDRARRVAAHALSQEDGRS